MNVIHDAISVVLPYIIAILEIMGIFIVTWSVIKEFWEYIQNTFMKKQLNIQFNLAVGLATGLEFKMAAEILKTVIIQSLDELLVLGAVILIRALMSVLIHFEIKEPYVKVNEQKDVSEPKETLPENAKNDEKESVELKTQEE